jgi:cyclomaltodextrinase
MNNKSLLFLIISLNIIACNRPHTRVAVDYPSNDAIVGLASPIQLVPVETRFLLSEYFLNATPDSIQVPVGLTFEIRGDTLLLRGNIVPPMEVLRAWFQGFSYVIPVKKSMEVGHEFVFDPKGETYSKVQVKGEFNAWNPNNTPLNFSEGKWLAEAYLAPGEYPYLFVVDGKEMRDPENEEIKDNGMGGFNSILTIDGTDPRLLPELFTHSFEPGRIQLQTLDLPNRFMVFWQNMLLGGTHLDFQDGNLAINLPLEADTMERSYLRAYVINDAGISDQVFVPLEYGVPITQKSQLKRTDKHAMSMYFLMIDRFKDGNPSNNFPVDDPSIHPRANYHGGDLTGVLEALDQGYFEELGVNTVWLSPVITNPEGAYGLYPEPRSTFSGYHGYWPIRSTVVDYRYGTMDELKELVTKSHDHDLNVLLDYVANHVHEEHPIYKEHPDWVTNLYLPDGTLNTEKWDEHRLTTWFDVFLPTLDLSRPEVVEALTDSAMFWLKNVGIDGFRHDATKHIPEIFWETLTRKVKTDIIIGEGRSVYQIGETYGSKALINSYVGTGKLDGQFDFNVYDDAIATLAREEVPFSRLENSLKASFATYGPHNLMGYITGNQDRARFISYASGDVKFEEDAKYAGWTREIIISDSAAYDKLAQLVAFNTTIPGIPVIYYGDEIGLPGANDPDNRRMMKFDNLDPKEEALKQTVSRLFHLRYDYPALIYGDTRFLFLRENQWAYMRSWFGQHIVVAFNKDKVTRKLEVYVPEDVKGSVKPLLDENRKIVRKADQLAFELPPNGVEIIEISEK